MLHQYGSHPLEDGFLRHETVRHASPAGVWSRAFCRACSKRNGLCGAEPARLAEHSPQFPQKSTVILIELR